MIRPMTTMSPKANPQDNSQKPEYDPDEAWESAILNGLREGFRRRDADDKAAHEKAAQAQQLQENQRRKMHHEEKP